MIYCFDIDGTLCSNSFGDYEKAEPIQRRIDFVNQLYDQGHIIKLLTARGSTTQIDWREFTETQLLEWGVKYTILMLGKPEADIYIDDKGINDKDFFKDHS